MFKNNYYKFKGNKMLKSKSKNYATSEQEESWNLLFIESTTK